MYHRSRPDARVTLDRVGIFADGVAVREVGELTFPIVQATVDEIVRVSNDEICAAIKDIFDDTRSIMEPAGALAVAGLRAWVERTGATGTRLAAVLSGANMNFDRLRFVAERAEVGEAREALFGVTIPERAGAFREFCATIGRRVVTEFNYRLSGRDRRAHLRRHRDAFAGGRAPICTTRSGGGYETLELTDNELAKLHVRHMVGGRSAEVAQRAVVPVRISRAARRADDVPRQARRPVEHQPVPLPQPRRRLRPRARRLRSAARGRCRRSRRSWRISAIATSANWTTTPISCFSRRTKRSQDRSSRQPRYGTSSANGTITVPQWNTSSAFLPSTTGK